MSMFYVMFCVFKQKTAYEMRISDWSSDVCSSDLAGLAPGYSLGEALPYMEGIIQRIAPDVQIDFKGESREFYKSSTSIYFVFMLALGFIYLLLAAPFESFVDPFIIILSVQIGRASCRERVCQYV